MSDTKKMSFWDIENALLGEILCFKSRYFSGIKKFNIVKVSINNSGPTFILDVLTSTTDINKYYFNFKGISDLINGKTVNDGYTKFKIEKV